MATHEYDYAVFIGRFQPFHNGHLRVVEKALEIARTVIILVGSSNVGRSTRNPFTFLERESMIRQAMSGEALASGRIQIAPLPDCSYDDHEWVQQVQHAVRSHASSRVTPNIALVGQEKDNSTYYLRLFPQWTYVGVNSESCHATTIRDEFFEPGANLSESVVDTLPDTTWDALIRFRDTRHFGTLMEEHAFLKSYREKYGRGPFMTVDACCILGGHVALVERTRGVGKGLLALPGGFLEPDESLLQGAVRELNEETGLDFSVGAASMMIKAERTFDDPHRSQRARLITHAYLFDMEPFAGRGLPKLKCLDPEEDTRPRWVPLSELTVSGMFEDHAHIIRTLLAKA